MGSMFRLGTSKLARSELSKLLCKVTQNHNVVPVAFMTRKANLVGRFEKPAPFPYWKKEYSPWYQVTDPGLQRYDENSRLIVVEGPPASGKSEFAKKIAEEFNMFYMPSPTHDEYYVNLYGFDLRDLNPELPDHMRFYDIKDFLTNPHHRKTADFQLTYLFIRYEQYRTAILHLLSTGQGVVLNKSVYSDQAYMNSMFKAGYISKPAYAMYKHFVGNIVPQLLRPHLIIYLDVPVECVKKNIKKRGIPYEVNSKVLTTEYLKNIEDYYKHSYLDNMSDHSEILVYDWREKPDMEFVFQDIASLDLDNYASTGKMSDWIFPLKADLDEVRVEYHDAVGPIYDVLHTVDTWPEEFLTSADDQVLLDEVMERVPSEQYAPGFHPLYDKKFAKHEPYIMIRNSPRDSMDPEVQERLKKYVLNPT